MFTPDWRAEDAGNCLQACIASLFDLPLDEVPHFIRVPDWWEALNNWLGERGLYVMDYPTDAGLPWMAGYQLIYGKSPRGDFNHIVVGFEGAMVHDPHPSRDGLENIKGVYLFVSRLKSADARREE